MTSLFALLCACAHPGEPAMLLDRSPPHAVAGVLILGDTQEHHLLGTQLKSNGRESERIATTVARRSPVSNLGSRYVFEFLIQQGSRANAQAIIHLGDVGDVGCVNELEVGFSTLLSSKLPSFVAPGNHDFFLAGNFNSYLPWDASRKAQELKTASVFESLRSFDDVANTAWQTACFAPDAKDGDPLDDFSPATKVLYLRRYLSFLAAQGISVTTQALAAGSKQCAPFEASHRFTDQGLSFAASGELCTGEGYGWHSWIIQKLEWDDRIFILMDSSFPFSGGVFSVLSGPAVVGSFEGDEQAVASKWFAAAGNRARVIFAHHPAKELTADSRRFVAESGALYVSGHRHDPTGVIRYPEEHFTELNVASVADWPSQAVILSHANGGVFASPMGEGSCPGLEMMAQCDEKWRLDETDYQQYRSKPNQVEELRRQLEAAAKKLPEAVPAAASATPLGIAQQLSEIRKRADKDGRIKLFWACQARWAAEASIKETAWTSGFSSPLKVRPLTRPSQLP